MHKKGNALKALLEQKNRELRSCHAAVENLMQKSPLGILIVARDMAIRFANPGAAAILGCPTEELVGKPFAYPVVPGKTTELTVKGGDGQMVTAEMWVAETEWSAHKAYFVSLQDITERKRGEDSLRESGENLRAIFNSACDAIFIHDLDGNIIDVNDKALEMYGVDRNQATRLSIRDDYSGPDNPLGGISDIWARVMAGESQFFQWQARRPKDGSLFQVEVYLRKITLKHKDVILANIRDITARKRAEEKIEILNTDLAAQAAELEAANRELEAFSHTVSHDLRTPLTNISGYSQVVLDLCAARLNEQCRDYLQEIVKGTERMNQLIDTILNFSRLTRLEIIREPVNLCAMAKEIATELQAAEPGRKVTFTIADGMSVNGDPQLLRVMLENLLGNAWKYTCRRDTAVIELGMTEVEGKSACFVRDNGVGFDMTHVDSLFTPFQRLPGAGEFEGHGIGLATVQRIIQRHGGRVWAEGEAGKGATFYFTLP